jgi:hypothetical protein
VIRHLLIVAIGFRFAGMLLAVASTTTLVDVAGTWFEIRRLPPPEIGPPLDLKTYGLVGLLHNAARGFGYGVHAMAGLFSILLVVLAVTAIFGLLVAVLLYLTGSGIGRHAIWARIVAILTASLLALASCAVMAVMRRDHAPFAALPIGISLYALWVMIWRFA